MPFVNADRNDHVSVADADAPGSTIISDGTASPEAKGATGAGSARRAVSPRRRMLIWDLAAYTSYLAVAIFVTIRLWMTPGSTTLRGPGGVDLQFFEFCMAHGARVITDLQNPFYTTQINAPYGVNMMANTSVLGLSIPMTPVTVLFGPHISALVVLVLCLAGTAAAWYYLLSRHMGVTRGAAFIAGALCGFAPAMMSQAVGHLNFIAQFLIPFIGWRVVKLGEPGRAVRNGVALGLLVVWQAFLNEEFLLFSAIGCFFFVATWAISRPREAKARFKPFIAGLGVATLIGCVALAYPLYRQFYGQGSYEGLPFTPAKFYADVYSYFIFSSESLAGDPVKTRFYALNTSEENTFLGWPLMLLTVIIAIWLWRVVAARAALVVALVFGSISLGSTIMIARNDTGIPGPYRYLAHLPLIDLSMPSRYALMVVPMVAVLLALATDRVTTAGIGKLRPTRALQIIWYAVIVAVLLPIAPTPLGSAPAPQTPHFITSGAWRDHVDEDGTLVPVPIPSGSTWSIHGMRWSAAAGLDYKIPSGYFIGPSSPDNRAAVFTAPPSSTTKLLNQVARGRWIPPIDGFDRAAFRDDLRLWNASVVVLGPHPQQDKLRETMERLLGPGQRVDDVWLWDVRNLSP